MTRIQKEFLLVRCTRWSPDATKQFSPAMPDFRPMILLTLFPVHTWPLSCTAGWFSHRFWKSLFQKWNELLGPEDAQVLYIHIIWPALSLYIATRRSTQNL